MSYLLKFYLYIFFNNLRLGSCIVFMAWSALEVSNQLAVLGRMFLISSLVTLFLGPLIGTFIDSYNRRTVLAAGHAIIFLSFITPLLSNKNPTSITLEMLYCLSFFSTFGSLFINGAADAIFQAIIPADKRSLIRARYGVIQQLALLIGTAAMGYFIDINGIYSAYLALIIINLASFSLTYFLPSTPPHSLIGFRDFKEYYTKLKEGIAFTFSVPPILLYAIAIAFTFSLAQVTNLLLPDMIRNGAQGGSRLYGNIEALWAVGGILTSWLLSIWLKNSPLNTFGFISLCLGGLLALSVPFLIKHHLALLFLFGVLGGCFSCSRILSDGQLLSLCPTRSMGRVRTTTSSLSNFLGLIIYLSPSFLPSISSTFYYASFGGILFLASSGLWFIALKKGGNLTYIDSQRELSSNHIIKRSQ